MFPTQDPLYAASPAWKRLHMTSVDFGLQNAKSSDGKMFLVSGHRPAPKGCFEQFAGHRLQMPT